jgi:hypothetical protein
LDHRLSAAIDQRRREGTFRSNTEGTVRGGFSMTRADVATYLLGAIDDAAVVRKTVVIAN